MINLTPHTIRIYDDTGKRVIREYPPSGDVMRVTARAVQVVRKNDPDWKYILPDRYQWPKGPQFADGIPVYTIEYGDITGMPMDATDPSRAMYIVSLFVLQALAADHYWTGAYVSPDTSPDSVVRDAEGNIIGFRRWIGIPD